MLKGRGTSDNLFSSTHGGWKFNLNFYGPISPSDAAALTSSQLQTNPLFDVTGPIFFADTNLFRSTGSAYALAHHNRILSDAIPALTLPVGANPVPKLSPPLGTVERNFDEQTLKNNWPADRTSDQGNWHHSDCRQVAYTFTHKLFDDIVTFGGLK